ncbi:MAG: hypothetical protein JNJ54_04645 [Myxococcaceae bacterium]|nr:hypothetical protein [Myxococcaceae bacterium]
MQALSKMNLGEGDGTSACRVMRALADCLMDIAVVSGAPPGVVAEQIGRVLSRRLPELKPGKPVLIQKEGKA